MITTNPDLLPKVRSPALMAAMAGMPCSLRVASFIGLPCSGIETVVGCHLPTIGKGMGTKTSDLSVAAGCQRCHDIIDGRNGKAQAVILDRYPAAYFERLLKGLAETHARLAAMGIITVTDGELK